MGAEEVNGMRTIVITAESHWKGALSGPYAPLAWIASCSAAEGIGMTPPRRPRSATEPAGNLRRRSWSPRRRVSALPWER